MNQPTTNITYNSIQLPMESPSPSYYDYSYSQQHSEYSSRPTLGFPLGTGLLLIVIFSLSGILSCCYHWDKLRHLRRNSFSDEDDHQSTSKPNNTCSDALKKENQSFPVVMPGDQIARFIAMPCPCEPARREPVVAEQAQKTQKPPPHVALTLC